jgi:hypothetical protein
MCKPELRPGQWDADLAVVHMAGEHQVERARRERVEHLRVVAEQDAEVGVSGRELGRALSPARPARAGIGAGHVNAPSTHLERLALVRQQSGRRQVGDARPLGERVARDGEVVVAEDREGRLRQPCEQRAQTRLARTAREQVAAETDEVGLPLGRPLDGALDRDRSARGQAEMKVGEMDDAQAVELVREPLQPDLDAAEPYPAGLEPAPGDGGRRYGGECS